MVYKWLEIRVVKACDFVKVIELSPCGIKAFTLTEKTLSLNFRGCPAKKWAASGHKNVVCRNLVISDFILVKNFY